MRKTEFKCENFNRKSGCLNSWIPRIKVGVNLEDLKNGNLQKNANSIIRLYM